MKRIVSLILALAMVLSLASFAAAEEATGIASWKAFDKTVTLQIPVYDRGYKVSVQENYWTKWIQENFELVKKHIKPMLGQETAVIYKKIA